MKDININSSISKLAQIGQKRVDAFQNINILSILDLFYFFPRKYLNRKTIKKISNLEKGEICSVIGKVETFGNKRFRNKTMSQVVISDNTGLLTLTWFNKAKYIKNLFSIGDEIVVFGKIGWFNGFSITHPNFEIIGNDNSKLNFNSIIPIYSLSQELKNVRIDQSFIRNIMYASLSYLNNVKDFYNDECLKEYKLIHIKKALESIHFPKDNQALQNSIRRLKFDEHFFLQLLMSLRRRSLRHNKTKSLSDIGPYFKKITDLLPFELTKAQKRVIKEIHFDMKNDFPMNRLLQGDVGSGKTIVSILSALLAVGNNVQVAIMAPTEILAYQHYNTFIKELNKVNISCCILTGKLKKSEKNKIVKAIKSGSISVVVGTHALIQKDVFFKRLGLVIVDEQHRFGVKQRSSLIGKGLNPHFLSMTATPIPRTLAMSYMGDMDVSIIDELPSNRKKVITKAIDEKRLNSVYSFIKDQVALGRQCMIIYPLVEESEKIDLAAATEAYEKLKKETFSKVTLGLVHGKISSEEKKRVMKDFELNKINILISTTVIEVGVNVPNATVMLIEHAERFGLMQLHQLRGRVGRGIEKSYCILVNRKTTEKSDSRLSIMEKTSDGFEIANEDLKIRGPGDFFGLNQSGYVKQKIADLINDGPIINEAKKLTNTIIMDDPRLEKSDNYLIKERFMAEYQDKLYTVKIS